MDIELKLNKDFERTLNSLRTEFGEDFEDDCECGCGHHHGDEHECCGHCHHEEEE